MSQITALLATVSELSRTIEHLERSQELMAHQLVMGAWLPGELQTVLEGLESNARRMAALKAERSAVVS